MRQVVEYDNMLTIIAVDSVVAVAAGGSSSHGTCARRPECGRTKS